MATPRLPFFSWSSWNHAFSLFFLLPSRQGMVYFRPFLMDIERPNKDRRGQMWPATKLKTSIYFANVNSAPSLRGGGWDDCSLAFIIPRNEFDYTWSSRIFSRRMRGHQRKMTQGGIEMTTWGRSWIYSFFFGVWRVHMHKLSLRPIYSVTFFEGGKHFTVGYSNGSNVFCFCFWCTAPIPPPFGYFY